LGNLGGGGVLGDIGNLVGGFLGGTGGSSLGNILGSAVNYGVPLAMAKQAQQTNQARADELKRSVSRCWTPAWVSWAATAL
jgi:membrane protein YqaA with SNARE-associated domain